MVTVPAEGPRRNWVEVPAWDAELQPRSPSAPGGLGPTGALPPFPPPPPKPPGPLATLLAKLRPGHTDDRYNVASRALTLALVILLVLSGSAWAATDLDRDGLPSYEEWGAGTRSGSRDTDGDGLPDGWEVKRGLDATKRDADGDGLSDRYEAARGMDPFASDADGDGIDDRQEVEYGSDPASEDTDGDGIADREEGGDRPRRITSEGNVDLGPDPDDPVLGDAFLGRAGGEPAEDCDSDGIIAILDADDDNDGRRDGDEDRAHRCDPDVDDDGVLDGDEGALTCIVSADCDDDGLLDADEAPNGFDPLDPDTFDVRILDATVHAFAEAGQRPSSDTDGDSIPDDWESSSGLIDWGDFRPSLGERDLLVEFVRVMGPDSKRYAYLDFTNAYVNVANAFHLGGQVRMQWVETRVTLPTETIAPFLPSSDSAYYSDVLSKAAYSDNPYVTTVVMNPQHDQSGVLHYGAAPIRGMLAAVDYGTHTESVYAYGQQEIVFSPIWESIAHADRQDLILAAGFRAGGVNGLGDVYLETSQYTLRWRSFWFASNPQVFPHNGSAPTSLAYRETSVDLEGMQRTIMHELGHTLGLCHTELPDCRGSFSAVDQQRYRESAMYSGGDDTLRFLGSEWEDVGVFLTCPPQPPIGALAEGAPPSEIIEAKYSYQLEEITNVQLRGCGDLGPIARDVERGTFGAPYEAAEADAQVPDVESTAVPALGFVALVFAAGAGASWLLIRRLLPTPGKPQGPIQPPVAR